jgi:hypothetical protein
MLMKDSEAQKVVFDHLQADPELEMADELADGLKKLKGVRPEDVDVLVLAPAAVAAMFNAYVDVNKPEGVAKTTLGNQDLPAGGARTSNRNRARLEHEIQAAEADERVKKALALLATDQIKKSETMRRLSAAGVSNGAIAKLIEKHTGEKCRYQFVYQVLNKEVETAS